MLGEFVFIVIALFFISWLWFIVSDLSKEKDNQQREFAAKAKLEAKAKAYAIAEQEAFQKSELEADRIAELEREEIRKAEEVAEDLFINARSVNFRKWTSPPIIVDFVPRWLEYNNYAEIIEIDELYIESGASDLEKQLEKLAKNFGKIPFFCINDTCDNAESRDKRLQLVKNKMRKLLPNKSSFEI